MDNRAKEYLPREVYHCDFSWRASIDIFGSFLRSVKLLGFREVEYQTLPSTTYTAARLNAVYAGYLNRAQSRRGERGVTPSPYVGCKYGARIQNPRSKLLPITYISFQSAFGNSCLSHVSLPP